MNLPEYEAIHETKSHGNHGFPFNIYLCSIPLDFSAIPTHWHNEMELIYVKKGHGQVSIDLEQFNVTQGDIAIVPPGRLHAIGQLPGCSMEYENIMFHLSMLMAAQGDFCTEHIFQPLRNGQLSLPHYFSPDSPHYPALSRCLDQIDEICSSFLPGYQLAIKSQLFALFYTLLPSMQKPPDRQKDKSFGQLKIILKYIETNYMKKISIKEAAGICGFSESHFMKYFKSHMSVSFTEYLNDYRLTIAARLLLSSSDSIVNIAAETGFENLSYFNRIFKKKYHCTPTMFRLQQVPY